MIDHHAHPFDREPGPFEPSRLAIDLDDMHDRRADAPVRPDTVWRALLVSRLAARLGVAPAEVADARAAWEPRYPQYVRSLFADAGLEAILMDAAWPPDSERFIDDFAGLSGCDVHLLWRLEPHVDGLLDEGASAADVVDRVEAQLASLEGRYCGLKTVLAYRTGLSVDPTATVGSAERALVDDGPSPTKPLRDVLFRRLLRHAADTRTPLQVHTGFGDSDLRLRNADPLLMEDVLDTPEGRTAPVVLLHSGFPFSDRAAYLAAARRNVHVDVSLINVFTPANLVDGVRRVFGLAPVDRVLFGTDAYVLPEAFWFAATLLRDAWDRVRAQLAELGMDPGWLDDAEEAVFAANARRLYRLVP